MNDNDGRCAPPGHKRRFARLRGGRLLRAAIFLFALAYALAVTAMTVAVNGADARPLAGREGPGLPAAPTRLSP